MYPTSSFTCEALGYPYNSIPPGFIRNKMVSLGSLQERRNRLDLSIVLNIFNRKLGLNPHDFFTFVMSSTRGSKNKICLPLPKTTVRISFFTHRAESEYVKFLKNLHPSSCLLGWVLLSILYCFILFVFFNLGTLVWLFVLFYPFID